MAPPPGWTDTLLTGIHEIDQQHQVLFDVAARFDQAVTSEDKWSAVHYALVELTNFANIHFAVEEALLRLHDYPDLEAHIAEHRKFSLELAEIKAHSIRDDVSAKMADMVRKWLIEHIGGHDRAYVAHLRSAAVANKPPG
ncbi:MAG: bacteriohemerythrin [Burkholderiaceae bacterium]|nr:bacteriohemerythrin [Sulfuritalea sp.]MCF8175249.1 bacteriohemerythrin [Burkholderiaceae bacterium]MCF8184996.1 bacteriohemerythrin [Polynucleobacter sp.]